MTLQPLTFADRLDFAAGRAARVFIRRSAIRLAYRAHQLRLRRWTVAAPSAGMGPEAMPQPRPARDCDCHLMPRRCREYGAGGRSGDLPVAGCPWCGGLGVVPGAALDRIEPGRAPQISATCSASAALTTLVTLTAAIAA